MRSHVRESILRSYIGSLMSISENADGSKSVTMSKNAEDIIYTKVPSNRVTLDHWRIRSDGIWSVRAVKHSGGDFTVTGKDINECLSNVKLELEHES